MALAPSAARPLALAMGGLVALAVSQGIGRFVYTPILPRMVAEWGLTPGQAGLIASANFLGYLLGALLAAAPFLSGRPRLTMIGALVVSSLSGAAMGLATSFPAFALLRFFGGLASAFVLVFSSALILERLNAAGRGDLSAVHFAGVGIGICAAAALVAGLGAAGASWASLWIASGLASLLATGAVAALVPDAEPSGTAAARSGEPVAVPALARLTLAYGLFGFGYVVTATFLVALVRGSPRLAPLEPFIWFVVGLSGVPSVWLWTRLARSTGLARAFALACLLEAAGVILSVAWESQIALVLSAILLGGTFMGISALGLMGGRLLGHVNPRRTMAVMTSAFGVGQIVGPAFAGFAFDVVGSFVLPSLAAAAALVLAAALTLGVRIEA